MNDTQYIVQAYIKFKWEEVKAFDDIESARQCLKKQVDKFPCTRYRLIKFTLIEVVQEARV